MEQSTSTTIFRLTALWALCESGLGGWMHALQLPFTGFFVGAFAVVIISLIAWYSRNNFRQIVQATILVILVKAAVSPQSPPPAYLAVAFQGLTGALLFRLIPSFRFAAVVLGIAAMVESAVQKLIIATLIYGNSLWEAINQFFKSILKDLHLPGDLSYSAWVIIVYTTVYAAWGLTLGLWIGGLPGRIDQEAGQIRDELSRISRPKPVPSLASARKKNRLYGYLIVLLLILAVLLAGYRKDGYEALYIVLRTCAVLAFLAWVLNPFVRWLLQRSLANAGAQKQDSIRRIIAVLPQIRGGLKPAYQLARRQKGGFKRFTRFIFILIVITLHPETIDG